MPLLKVQQSAGDRTLLPHSKTVLSVNSEDLCESLILQPSISLSSFNPAVITTLGS